MWVTCVGNNHSKKHVKLVIKAYSSFAFMGLDHVHMHTNVHRRKIITTTRIILVKTIQILLLKFFLCSCYL